MVHAGAQGLEFLRPVSRELVHKASTAEVLLTDSIRLEEDRFLVAAQWPRDHALYHPDASRRYDPLLFAESIRQMSVYLPHTYYDVPLGMHFIGDGLSFALGDADALRVGERPLEVVLDARWTWVGPRRPARFGMRLDVDLLVEGRRCGSGSITSLAVDERRYTLLRNRNQRFHSAPSPAEAEHTALTSVQSGRLRAGDCVLARGGTAGQWLLRIDTGHAILFDHPSDHIPLMLAMEAFRQLGHHLLADTERPQDIPPVLGSVQVQCLSFGENDQPVHLTAEVGPQLPGQQRDLRISAYQGGTAFAVADTRWTAPTATSAPVYSLGAASGVCA